MARDPRKLPEKSTQPPDNGFKRDLAQEISRRIDSLVPSAQRTQVVAQIVSLVQEERFSGPIAHPKHLREYEEIVPGSADRIVAMAEGNLAHAQTMQAKALDADITDMREGRWLGFAALIILIIGAIVCGVLQHTAIALALLGASVIGGVSAIIKGRGAKEG